MNSYVEVPVIRQVHERFGVTYAAKPETSTEQPSQPLLGITPPPRSVKRDNNPYMQPAKQALDVVVERQEDRWDDPARYPTDQGRLPEAGDKARASHRTCEARAECCYERCSPARLATYRGVESRRRLRRAPDGSTFLPILERLTHETLTRVRY